MFHGKIHYKLMVIPHSYVNLPEGKWDCTVLSNDVGKIRIKYPPIITFLYLFYMWSGMVAMPKWLVYGIVLITLLSHGDNHRVSERAFHMCARASFIQL